VEAALDVQYEMGIAPGIETEFWHWLPMDFCADLHAMTTALLSYSNVSVMSISYGWQGDLSQLRCSPAQAEVVETNLAKLAAKGVSVIVASGDSGAAYHRVSSRSVVLYPSWPASSPWVTAVGATRFVNQTIGSSEMAADQFGSGGGFSTRFNRSAAPWQASAVAAYLDQAGSLPLFPPAGSFPPNGRATPDVALLGEGYQTTLRGNVVSVGGTSASCPAFAAMVSLLNEARRQAGKPQLGCLNPFLYANAAAFTDVTRGTNAIDRRGRALPAGYAAAKGWDAATGLGSPVFGKLLAAALKL
jgi:tripeptidyl-peptidase-1